jgi:hypothetical protein
MAYSPANVILKMTKLYRIYLSEKLGGDNRTDVARIFLSLFLQCVDSGPSRMSLLVFSAMALKDQAWGRPSLRKAPRLTLLSALNGPSLINNNYYD